MEVNGNVVGSGGVAAVSAPSAEPLLPGTPAPDFTLPGGDGITLSGLRGQPVILAFSPPGWDPSRREQMAAYNQIVDALGRAVPEEHPAHGAQLLDLSIQGLWCDLDFASDEKLRFPLVGDLNPNGAVARAYGVEGMRALFVVDGEGVIRWGHASSSGVPPRAENVLAALDALDGTRETGSERPNGAPREWAVTRRDFVATALAAALALAAGPLLTSPAQAQQTPAGNGVGPAIAPPSARGTIPIALRVNGTEHTLNLEPRVALLDALRENLGMTGTKKGCDHGQCGACTVHRNGERILSCLTLAAMCEGDEITTIEGLAKGDDLHPVQAAFIEHDGFQCGYCTPGQIMAGAALLKEGHYKTDAELREGMSGNLCRCGAYVNIIAALKAARDNTSGPTPAA